MRLILLVVILSPLLGDSVRAAGRRWSPESRPEVQFLPHDDQASSEIVGDAWPGTPRPWTDGGGSLELKLMLDVRLIYK